MFDEHELILFDDGNGIQSGGYSIGSILMKSGCAPMRTDNSPMVGGSSGRQGSQVSSMFSDLVVPAGLFFDGGGRGGDCSAYSKHSVLSDDIYDTLLKQVSPAKAKSITRKRRASRDNRRTRKAKG